MHDGQTKPRGSLQEEVVTFCNCASRGVLRQSCSCNKFIFSVIFGVVSLCLITLVDDSLSENSGWRLLHGTGNSLIKSESLVFELFSDVFAGCKWTYTSRFLVVIEGGIR